MDAKDSKPERSDAGAREAGFFVSLMSLVLGGAQRARAQRFTVFLAVGWLGFALQLTALAFLTSVAHWPWLPATIVAVELAVVHNFIWHERVTWRDRDAGGIAKFAGFARF